MAAFSDSDYNSTGYSDYRPRYPGTWYSRIKEYHSGARGLVVDVGCGPGTATFQLRENLPFKRVVGVDVSTAMVERARQTAREKVVTDAGRVEFVVSTADNFSFLNGAKADMITAAQCVHWLDWERFQLAAADNLRAGGTLAIWDYTDPSIVGYPELDPLMKEFIYGESHLGPHWEQPGTRMLKQLLRNLHFDEKLFDDIYVCRESTDDALRGTAGRTPLHVEKTMTLEQMNSYLSTWSAFHSWRKQDPAGSIAAKSAFFQFIFSKTSMSWSSEVCLTWNSVGILARRR
ncbi:AGR110Wp [Eremothecium gossypii ATCC 10895]|uniref:AGR110Wp n=1 Tax=Eremothecium gossypii (strain ATCC 10895 / CBS 109.51 / FGSC 9923 / NRRL Y-1056) TaxID=284811 RepID=Q74ZT8_EREGS|nr:AGR110Wp [Eremothecium gossypii ATCC 10895]AAS54600.1 AGR110Wp [Eremothecium gossypii ATCC 10895]